MYVNDVLYKIPKTCPDMDISSISRFMKSVFMCLGLASACFMWIRNEQLS